MTQSKVIKNHYINNVHGITGVALTNMSVSTIPSYPFCLIVDLEMLSYNHKPFLPMIKDFNQSLHWGKYRHYMGRAAKQLDDYVSKDFLVRPLGQITAQDPIEVSGGKGMRKQYRGRKQKISRYGRTKSLG